MGRFRTKRLFDRLLFHGRILFGNPPRSSIPHRAAPDQSACQPRPPVHSQPPRHRRRAHFFHYVPTGILYPDRRIEVLTPTGYLAEPRQIPNPRYEKPLFARKLAELGLTGEFTRRVVNNSEIRFHSKSCAPASYPKGSACRMECRSRTRTRRRGSGCWPAPITRSSSSRAAVCERILFPATPSQRNGIEDAASSAFGTTTAPRLLRHLTAYDGRVVVPELVDDFDSSTFVHYPHGPAAKTKAWPCFRGRSAVSMPCSPARTTKIY